MRVTSVCVCGVCNNTLKISDLFYFKGERRIFFFFTVLVCVCVLMYYFRMREREVEGVILQQKKSLSLFSLSIVYVRRILHRIF